MNHFHAEHKNWSREASLLQQTAFSHPTSAANRTTKVEKLKASLPCHKKSAEVQLGFGAFWIRTRVG